MKKFAYGLIGDELEIKKNIRFEVDKNGRFQNLKYENFDKKITHSPNTPTFLVLPGLINSHVHIGDSFAKEWGFNKNLIDVVAPPDGIKHKLLRKISPEIKKVGIIKAAEEMLSNGITYFMDFREEGLEGIKTLKKALKAIPIKYRIFGRFNTTNEIKQIFKEADGIGLSSYKNIIPQVKTLLEESKAKYKKLITTHYAEVKRKEQRFNNIILDGLIDVIIHGTHLSKNDLEKLRENGISLVFCPRSNGYFGVGFPPIREVMDLNISISLGTDNIMNVRPDLFEELRYLFLIFKVLNKSNRKITLNAKQLLKMISINAARTFGIQDSVGSIKEGKYADFIVINLKDSNFYCSSVDKKNIYPLIVQRIQTTNIKQVYIQGEKVVERN